MGEFLRARREAAPRAELGFPATARMRTAGLRREEVAVLSGVSATWYTWLEQGRDINPSQQVLEAVGRALRLSPAERDYVLALGGYTAPPAQIAENGPPPPHIQRFLDAMAGYPAFAIGPTWNIVAWNRAYAALYPAVESTVAPDRNLLLLVFEDPAIRELLPDWEIDSQRFLAEFRAEAGPRLGEPAYTGLIDRLLADSEHFRAGWSASNIERFASRERRFFHRDVGELLLEHHQLSPADAPGVQIVAYLPVPGGVAAARLQDLIDRRTG